jgi:hypothetical protein
MNAETDREEFERLWPSLVIPGEYDTMDILDQQRWKSVIEQAYQAATLATAKAATLATAKRCMEICDEHASIGNAIEAICDEFGIEASR